MQLEKAIKAALLGIAVGDALGVPVEFKSRKYLQKYPATNMQGYGTYNQPPGTWSDDSSLTFCLAESLCQGYDLQDMAEKFIAWANEAYWSARGEVFDIGITTAKNISELSEEYDDLEKLKRRKCAAQDTDNGNGALMRILPLLFFIKGKSTEIQFEMIWETAALTHKHIRSALACFLYLKLAEYLLDNESKATAMTAAQSDLKQLLEAHSIAQEEQEHFTRLLSADLHLLPEAEIKSDGYVVHSLEAALWCFLRENTYEKTVLTAVNLGKDTDTTAAMVGGLAGLHYGLEAIPELWRFKLARLADIEDLAARFAKAVLVH